MKKKVFISIAGCIIIFVLFMALRYIIIDHSQKVHIEDFVDEEMGNLIIQTARFDEEILVREEKKIREEHVENISELNIGYTGYYNTLIDIKKCNNLQVLMIGKMKGVHLPYFYSYRELPEPEDCEKIKQIEEELGEILTSCSKLEKLYIWNIEETCNLSSLNFLKKNNSIKWLSINDMGDIDYSPILTCTRLVSLDLDGCNIAELGDISKLTNLYTLDISGTNISEWGDIVKLKNLERLSIKNTPLAEDEEQIELLYETLPDIEIDRF